MKILQINKFYYPRGGADHHFLEVEKILVKNGHAVIPFSTNHPDNLPSKYKKYFTDYISFNKVKGFAGYKNIFKMFDSKQARENLGKLIRDEKPDIAHVHLAYHQLPRTIFKVLARHKIKTVMTIHDWKIVCPNYHLYTDNKACTRCHSGRFYNCLTHNCIDRSYGKSFLTMLEAYYSNYKEVYADVDLFLAPSYFVKDILVSKFGFKKEKIRVLPHFLTPAMTVRKRIPPKRKICFSYAGRLSREKGIDKLVKFWHDANIRYPLHIYGQGPLQEVIERYIARNKLKRVKLAGRLEQTQLAKQLASSTAVIVPSVVYETFGLSCIEAFAQGTPVIANNAGPLPELVEKAGGGLVFDWNEPETLKKAILTMSKANDYGRNALAYMQKNHQVDHYYFKLMEIYEKIRKN